MAFPDHLYQAYIFDLDGTILLGDELLPGVAETLQSLRVLGRRVVFLSNNPTHTRSDFANLLSRNGILTSPKDIINSSFVMADFLKQRMPGGRLFVVGEQPLCDELRAAGFILTEDPAAIEAVIASFDRTFEYRKLQIAFDAIQYGAHFYATNADRYCPVPGGGEPDAASMIAAIEACTNHQVEAVVGKPSRFMAQAILDLLAQPPECCLITGDRLETDIQLGLLSGIDTALVLTGATDEATFSKSPICPKYILHRLSELLPVG